MGQLIRAFSNQLPALEKISPEPGGYIPVIRLMAVVFPAPFGPIMEKIRPFSTWKDSRCMACKPPKFFDISFSSRM